MALPGVAPVLAAALLIAAFASVPTSVQSIGVCYGVNGNDLPSPSDVVQLYKSTGISNMLIYSADRQALDALRDSGIGLILDVGQAKDVSELAANPSNANSWVQTNVQAYYPAVKINYIAVGNELTGTDAAPSILPAMQNVHDALQSAGLGSIKVSTAVKMDTINNSSPPSNGVFNNTSVMKPIVQFLASNNAPLLANVEGSGRPNLQTNQNLEAHRDNFRVSAKDDHASSSELCSVSLNSGGATVLPENSGLNTITKDSV